MKTAILAAILISLAACSGSSTSTSLGALSVNGPGISGSIPVGTTRLYTLDNIYASLHYTVRTEIATFGSGTTAADGTLSASIYTSEDAFKSDPTTSVAILTPDTNFPYVYEAYFQAPSSGSYVVAISGASLTVSDTQFFHDLRLMSADFRLPLSLISSPTPTQQQAYSGQIGAGVDYLNIFSTGSVSLPTGYYPIFLTSAGTATGAYPQMFVYGKNDQSLKISNLLYSSVTNSTDFIITDFTSSPTGSRLPTDPNNNFASGVTITAPFSNGTPTPFIVIRGISAINYGLYVGPGPVP